MKQSLIILTVLLTLSGCLLSPAKKSDRISLLKETYKSQEETRQAIDLIDRLVKSQMYTEGLYILQTLKIKFGLPTEEVATDPESVYRLTDSLKESVRASREDDTKWKEDYDKVNEYVHENSPSVMSKLKTSISWMVIILIIWGFLAPASLAYLIKYIRNKARESSTILKEEFEIKDRALKQTVNAIAVVKKEDPDTWEKVKPKLEITQDSDVKDLVKEINNGQG